MKDNRDPGILASRLAEVRQAGQSLSSAYDENAVWLEKSPSFNANPSCLEKYGAPVDKHKARLAAGLDY